MILRSNNRKELKSAYLVLKQGLKRQEFYYCIYKGIEIRAEVFKRKLKKNYHCHINNR